MTSAPASQVKLVAVTAGLSQPSSTRLLADRLTSAAVTAFNAGQAAVHVEVIELRDWARDLTNNLLTGFPSAELDALLARVAEADAVIAVSPIFSASYSGLFKTFFDVLDPEALVGTPVLIAATGGSARHSLALEHALRPLFSYLRAHVVPTAVYAATQDWASPGQLTARVDRAASELAQLVPAVSVPDHLDGPESDGEVIPFTRLLAGQRSAAGLQRR